jgi:hypothetical protein
VKLTVLVFVIIGGRHAQTDRRRHEVGVGSTTDQNRGTRSKEAMRALVFVALVGAVTTAWACGSPTLACQNSSGQNYVSTRAERRRDDASYQ